MVLVTSAGGLPVILRIWPSRLGLLRRGGGRAVRLCCPSWSSRLTGWPVTWGGWPRTSVSLVWRCSVPVRLVRLAVVASSRLALVAAGLVGVTRSRAVRTLSSTD